MKPGTCKGVSILLLGGVAIAALIVPAGSREAADTTAYPFKVCQERTGHLTEGPQPPLRLRWKFQSREGRFQIDMFPSVDDGFSPASVHDGTVYAGGHDGWIYAIDAATGEKIWEHKTGDHVMTTPTYHNGTVFAGSMDGYFRALDAADGSLRWQTQFGARTWNGLRYSGMRATPVFFDGKIFLGG